mgnify:CR=1 FL=1
MRIVNKKKFIKMIILIIGIIGISLICFSNISFSKGEIKTKTIYVSNGDTLWSIAEEEQEKVIVKVFNTGNKISEEDLNKILREGTLNIEWVYNRKAEAIIKEWQKTNSIVLNFEGSCILRLPL